MPGKWAFVFVYVYEIILFHAVSAGKCSQECVNANEKYCCTCQRQLHDRGFYRNCWRTDDPKCVRNCYTSLLLYDFENFSCFGCNRYRNSSTHECLKCPRTCLSCLDRDFCLDCKKGYYGNICDKRCAHCQTFHDIQSECTIDNGICIKGCLDGYYGHRCDTKCGECLPDESGAVKCEKDSGICLTGCANNYYGQQCERQCQKSLPDDRGRVVCDRDTGFCLNSCTAGYFGKACNNTCNDNCLSSKSKLIKCDKLSGNCTNGCTPGWYGTQCKKPCISNCFNRTCLQISGHCNDGCVAGWYGDTCNKQCSGSCLNRSCLQTSGYCSYGCVPGLYGDTCELHCADTCNGKFCNKETSACLHGCHLGYTGIFCNMISKVVTVSDSYQYIGGLVGAVTSLLLLLMIWIIRRDKLSCDKNSATSDLAESNYDDIYNTYEEDQREANSYMDVETSYERVSGTCHYELNSRAITNNDYVATTDLEIPTITESAHAGRSVSEIDAHLKKLTNESATASKKQNIAASETTEYSYDDIYNVNGLDKRNNDLPVYLDLETACFPAPSACLHEMSSNTTGQQTDRETTLKTPKDSSLVATSAPKVNKRRNKPSVDEM